jgi:flagellar biosynthetic protein FlhB
MKDEQRYVIPYDLQFFAKEGQGGEKTEPATAKRLKDAREDGKVAKSKELSSAVELVALFVSMKMLMSYFGGGLRDLFALTYAKIPDLVHDSAGGFTLTSFEYLMRNVLVKILLLAGPFFAIAVVVSFAISVLQVQWKITTKPLKPKFDKFNPINGFKRIFSKDSLFELVKSIAKILLVAYVAYSCVKNYKDNIFILYDIPLLQAVGLLGTIAINMGLKISMFYLVLAVADFIYQKFKFSNDMKMTKQEVKDEYKSTEGNPESKSKQRQRMREASRRRMMQDVPTADVVITNPTHYAVALKYDTLKASAPVVVAKGEDYLAQKIKEIARKNDVEIVENKPLARMLYANVQIGAEIPPELYQAVAEVLAYVYNIKKRA